jgi:hypothetical protein
MTAHSTSSDGQTRLAYILGVPLAPHCQRQWPQMAEVVSGSELITVEGNVSVAELHNGEAVTVTDYWGEPTVTPEWRRPLTGRLDMPPDGIWKDAQHLSHY